MWARLLITTQPARVSKKVLSLHVLLLSVWVFSHNPKTYTQKLGQSVKVSVVCVVWPYMSAPVVDPDVSWSRVQSSLTLKMGWIGFKCFPAPPLSLRPELQAVAGEISPYEMEQLVKFLILHLFVSMACTCWHDISSVPSSAVVISLGNHGVITMSFAMCINQVIK